MPERGKCQKHGRGRWGKERQLTELLTEAKFNGKSSSLLYYTLVSQTKKKSAGKKSFNGHTALYTYIISNQASTSAREQHTSKHGLNSQVWFFLFIKYCTESRLQTDFVMLLPPPQHLKQLQAALICTSHSRVASFKANNMHHALAFFCVFLIFF